MEKIYKDRDWLYKHYVAQGESAPIIAQEAGCTSTTIYNWLRKMNIPLRVCDKPYHNRDWLWGHYIELGESAPSIAEKVGCDHSTINNWLHKLDIPIRWHNELYHNKEWLYIHYVKQQKSIRVIAREIGCGHSVVRKWLHKMDIPVRTRGDGGFLARRNSLVLSPQLLRWIGGELLGDGCTLMTGWRSACYEHTSKYKEYIAWLFRQFTDSGMEPTGRIRTRQDEETGAITYRQASKSYPELVDVYKRWYPEGKKIVPKDLKLTPLVCRQWYIGDGHLAHPKRGRPSISFATCSFDKESVEYLVKELCKQGFKATRWPSNNYIGLSVHSVQDFLEWIGPCPISCYDYKWEI